MTINMTHRRRRRRLSMKDVSGYCYIYSSGGGLVAIYSRCLCWVPLHKVIYIWHSVLGIRFRSAIDWSTFDEHIYILYKLALLDCTYVISKLTRWNTWMIDTGMVGISRHRHQRLLWNKYDTPIMLLWWANTNKGNDSCWFDVLLYLKEFLPDRLLV